ncbi:hypothetical protein SAMN05216184_10228 [Georgenia satyanarayanai]|uniref:Uncharacterized protein n=1 Tax=Georgenia satyanarayanai TaxID=860221 RepID=A0A2Y9C470_9MICO|nr:hypothetical protein [Georgenia satyanarayanai]PYG00874.1 hypothetical protein A8987_10228 [Georgenia satyanarayanai]SSA39113.1 hypothetical protein SAMN05216184_10228 [Georgenia satyanarayanai]
MTLVLLALSMQTPTPPAPDPEMTIYTVTPGIAGFIVFVVLAFVGWLLFRSLTRHVRKVDHEGRRRAQDEAEGPEAGPGR